MLVLNLLIDKLIWNSRR